MWSRKKTVEPAGLIKDFAGSSIPGGWLSCDGSAVSRTTYARLFAVIGTSYGVGDGSTTFNLPDFIGRVSMHVDATALRVSGMASPGAASGAQSKSIGVGSLSINNTHAISNTLGLGSTTLALSQAPGHAHGLLGMNDSGPTARGLGYTGGDSYGVVGSNGTAGRGYKNNSPVDATPFVDTQGGGGSHTHSLTGNVTLTGNTVLQGTPGNADVIQPALAIYKIIKY